MSQTADHMFDSEISWRACPSGVLADLGGRFGAARFGKGELIYSPFDRADAMYIVQSGRVRLYRSAHDGRQLTLAMLDEGEVFGRVSPEGQALHDAYAEAMTERWCGCSRWPTSSAPPPITRRWRSTCCGRWPSACGRRRTSSRASPSAASPPAWPHSSCS